MTRKKTKAKYDLGMKFQFKEDVKEALEWRKEILLGFIDASEPSTKHNREYTIRLKEVDWLLSKCRKVK